MTINTNKEETMTNIKFSEVLSKIIKIEESNSDTMIKLNYLNYLKEHLRLYERGYKEGYNQALDDNNILYDEESESFLKKMEDMENDTSM